MRAVILETHLPDFINIPTKYSPTYSICEELCGAQAVPLESGYGEITPKSIKRPLSFLYTQPD